MAQCFSSAKMASFALSPYFCKSSSPLVTSMSSKALPMQKMEYWAISIKCDSCSARGIISNSAQMTVKTYFYSHAQASQHKIGREWKSTINGARIDYLDVVYPLYYSHYLPLHASEQQPSPEPASPNGRHHRSTSDARGSGVKWCQGCGVPISWTPGVGVTRGFTLFLNHCHKNPLTKHRKPNFEQPPFLYLSFLRG
jgi:hypothetical protein